MWDWLGGGPFSRGLFFSLSFVGLICFGGLMLFSGMLMVRGRSASFDLAGFEVALRDGRAVALGGALAVAGAGLLLLAATLLL